MATPSAHALSMVGQEVTLHENGREYKGICVGAERYPSKMVTDHGEFPSVRFCIRVNGRLKWSKSMPDEGDG